MKAAPRNPAACRGAVDEGRRARQTGAVGVSSAESSLMVAVKKLRYRLEYIAFLIVAAMARALPVDVASRWSGNVWRFIAPHLHRHKRAVNHLALAFPEKTPAEIEEIALEMWDNLGRVFAEFFHLDEIAHSDRIRIEPPEILERLRGRQGASVVCSLHMGNWELGSQAPMRFGWRLAGVYQRIHNPLIDEWVRVRRAPHYPGGLMEKSPATARTLMRHARDGGCAAVLADLRDPRGFPAPFFGRPAPSTLFPALVARLNGAPITVLRVKRLKDARFSIRVVELEVPRTEDRDADIAAGTMSLQAELEQMIREAPAQWMWANRRW
jgi:KDO2-lipid IV(A) lauroyltransferase